MANRYAVANGNWSSVATWDGGASLPTSADIVRPNGFNVTIDQTITVTALRNDASAPAVAGGTFTLTGNYTVNISSDIQCFATNLFIYNGTGTAYITGTNSGAAIGSSTTTNTTSTITHSGTGTLVVDMVINSSILNETNRYNIQVTGGGTLTCLKAIAKGGTGNYPNGGGAILISTTAGAVINTKDIQGPGYTGYTINSSVRTTMNVVGNITQIQLNAAGTPVAGAILLSGTDSSLSITGNIINNHVGTGDPRVVTLSAPGTINMVGNISGVWAGSVTTSYTLATTSVNSNLVLIGDVVGAGGSGPTIASAGGTTITGNITGGSLMPGVRVNSGTCTITGSVIGGAGGNGVVAVSGTLNINGLISGGYSNGSAGVNIAGATLNHIGTAQASALASAIICGAPTTSTVICTGPFLRSANIVAIASQTLKINAAYNPYFQFVKSGMVGLTYMNQASLSFPAITNVRSGVTYASGSMTGTMIVPSPSYVRLGIATDNTVGTAVITAADLFTQIAISANPLAVRLRQVSTVDTTGQQLVTYNNL